MSTEDAELTVADVEVGRVVRYKPGYKKSLEGKRFQICWPDPVSVREDGSVLVEIERLDVKQSYRTLAWLNRLERCD